MQVDIPDPVIETNFKYDWHDRDAVIVTVLVGGVAVLSKKYTTNFAARHLDNYVDEAGDAEKAILAEFGRRLAKLMED